MENASWHDVLRNDRPLIFGILNCTPDSFSDGGKYANVVDVQNRITQLIDDGSDVIDFGAESTRPGAKEVSFEEQLSRVEPVFGYLKNVSSRKILFSCDTRNSEVASKSIESGVKIINDVSGGSHDLKMLDVIASNKSLCVLMHMRGNPENMNSLAKYNNVVDDVCSELENTLDRALKAGISEAAIMIDPGIGFAKTAIDCVALLHSVEIIKTRIAFPMLIGLSRKSFLAKLMSDLPNSVKKDEIESATHYLSYHLSKKNIDALRVHEPASTLNAIKFYKNLSDK